jgi:hypothetical protein
MLRLARNALVGFEILAGHIWARGSAVTEKL